MVAETENVVLAKSTFFKGGLCPSVRRVLCWTLPTARGSVCHKTLPPFSHRPSRFHFLAGRYLEERGRGVTTITDIPGCLGTSCGAWVTRCGGGREGRGRVNAGSIEIPTKSMYTTVPSYRWVLYIASLSSADCFLRHWENCQLGQSSVQCSLPKMQYTILIGTVIYTCLYIYIYFVVVVVIVKLILLLYIYI